MFRLTRKPSRRRSITAPLDIDEAIAIDDIVHGRDRRGYLPDQRQRSRFWVRCTNNGLEPERVAFAIWLEGRGRIEG
jgi:hypothetical protein